MDKSSSTLTASGWSIEWGYSIIKHRNDSAKHHNDIEDDLVHGITYMHTNESTVKVMIFLRC